jgi:Gpi18-like mannosyltransferase
MPAVTLFVLLLALVGSYLLYVEAPRSGRAYRFSVPFRHAAASKAIWRKSNRFAGVCLFLSSLFIVVPPFIWGFGTAVQLFTLLIWGLVLLPLLTLTAYAYSLLLFLNERDKD